VTDTIITDNNITNDENNIARGGGLSLTLCSQSQTASLNGLPNKEYLDKAMLMTGQCSSLEGFSLRYSTAHTQGCRMTNLSIRLWWWCLQETFKRQREF